MGIALFLVLNHILNGFRAPCRGFCLKLLVINYFGFVGFIRYGADHNKRRAVQITSLRDSSALHFTAHTAKVGDYFILLLFFGNELITRAHSALKYINVGSRLLNGVYRFPAHFFIGRKSIQTRVRDFTPFKADSFYVEVVLNSVGRYDKVAYIYLAVERARYACIDNFLAVIVFNLPSRKKVY